MTVVPAPRQRHPLLEAIESRQGPAEHGSEGGEAPPCADDPTCAAPARLPLRTREAIPKPAPGLPFPGGNADDDVDTARLAALYPGSAADDDSHRGWGTDLGG